jgi:hypothetical protein
MGSVTVADKPDEDMAEDSQIDLSSCPVAARAKKAATPKEMLEESGWSLCATFIHPCVWEVSPCDFIDLLWQLLSCLHLDLRPLQALQIISLAYVEA